MTFARDLYPLIMGVFFVAPMFVFGLVALAKGDSSTEFGDRMSNSVRCIFIVIVSSLIACGYLAISLEGMDLGQQADFLNHHMGDLIKTLVIAVVPPITYLIWLYTKRD